MYEAQLATIGAYTQRNMVDAEVWREEATTDSGGGRSVTWVDQQRTVLVELTTPSDTERQAAAQGGVIITHTALLMLGADVEYGDRLLIDGSEYQLQSDPLTATHSAYARATVRKTPFTEPIEGN